MHVYYNSAMPKLFEHIKRSLVKAVTYRTIILIADGFIIFALTHRYDLALGVVLISNVSSTILYFVHERIWNHIEWGRIHHRVLRSAKRK